MNTKKNERHWLERTRMRRVVATAASLVLLLALAACGGGGDPNAATAAANVPAAAAASPLPFPAVRALSGSDVLAADDFEGGLANWSNWGNTQVLDGVGVSGSRALRVGTAAGGAGSTGIGIAAGGTYRLTAQTRVDDASETVYLGVSILDAAGQQIATQAEPVSSTSYSLATVDVVAPAGASSAVAFVWKNASSGYGYVDDVQLARLGAAPPPASGNLLSNAGFEAGMAGWVNWNNALVVDGAGTAASRALRVGTAAGGAGQDVTGIVAGAQYQLTAQARVSDASEVGYVGVNLLDAAGATVAQQAIAFSTTTLSQASVQVTAPSNAVKAVVFVWKNAGSGYAYVDDFALAPLNATPSPAAANLVVNPGFESGPSGWDWSGGNATLVSDAASGTSAARLGPGLPWVGQYINFTPGQSYTFSAQGKISSDSPVPLLVTIQFLDAWGENIGLDHTLTFRQLTYETQTTTVVVPPETAYVWVEARRDNFRTYDPTTTPVGSGYVDNVSVVASGPH